MWRERKRERGGAVLRRKARNRSERSFQKTRSSHASEVSGEGCSYRNRRVSHAPKESDGRGERGSEEGVEVEVGGGRVAGVWRGKKEVTPPCVSKLKM